MTRRFTFGAGRLPLAAVVALTLVVPARPAPAGDKGGSGVGVFDPGKVWSVHITLSAEEYAAIQPHGGFGGFGGFGSPPPLKEFVEKRTASVAAQVAGTAKGFVPTGGFGRPPGR
jgi:hypothetical protein